MKAREIREDVYLVGAVDWDRRLFDALVPIPDGTSYNAYLVQGTEGTALLDTVDPSMSDTLLSQLAEIANIDYVVAHHAEQDHSGSIPIVLSKYPEAKVVTSPKGKGMLIDLLRIPDEKFVTVEDRQMISLGNKTLEFIYTPWVHWPETMVTYLREDRILFSCDFFGAHLATSDLYVTEQARTYEAAKRYYAEIMMPFRTFIQKNLDKLEGYSIDVIAPSHGPVHDKPALIIDAYRDWASDVPKNVVVIPYVSMHGSTKKMVEYLVGALASKGVNVHQYDLTVTDIGELAVTLVDAATIVIGTSTVHVGPHPLVVTAVYLANTLRCKAKYASVVGSYGWGTKVVEQITGQIPNLKVELLEPVLCKGSPGEADFQALDRLANTIVEKHRGLGLA
jgi:flavorubredoxin